MKQQYTLALIPLLLLTGCMGGEEQSDDVAAPGADGDAYLSYSYPTDGQAGVSPEADVVLRFSHAITDEEADSKIKLLRNGENISYELKKVDGGRSLMLDPDGGLDAQSEYSVTFEGDSLSAADGSSIAEPNAEGEPGIQFSTRNLYDGPNNRVEGADSFEVASTVPLPDSQKSEPGQFGPMNFSTFRLRTTHPVHPQWRGKGGTIELTDSSGETVDANVIVRGNSISVDPCVAETLAACGSRDDVLEAGETYTLSLNNVPSKTDGDQLLNQEFKYTPRDTAPTVVAEQITVDSGLASGESQEQATKSILNGQFINGVTLNSVLQGTAGPSQQTGSLFAELGYAPNFGSDEPLPLRIPRNSVLRSTSIDVKVGGKVPILKAREGDGNYGPQETTGDIKVTMISDATGYLSPNPYTDNDNAPRHITLFMDIAMNTESEQPNAALSQDLMGVELRGIAMVRDGVLTIDAIGVVEPELLGQEYTDSTIAFNLKGDISEDAPTDAADLRPVDDEAPKLLSWMPGPENAVPDTRQDMQRPGDPVILNFNEPILGDSVQEGITLYSEGSEIQSQNLKTKVDGTTVTINRTGGFKHNVDYELNVSNQLTDLAGNGVTAVEPLSFSLPPVPESNSDLIPKRPPLALTTYPGYPCETDHTNLNLKEGVLGHCFTDSGEAYDTDTEIVNDTLPVASMPADRPITVVFSQSMNPDSIRLGETFIVEKVEADSDGKPVTAEPVSGRLEKNNQRIRFFPDEPWEEGSFYRYTMESNADPNPDTCTENPPKAVCGVNDLALKTDLLEGLDDGDGANGEDPMVIYFEGAESKETVFTPLRNLPIRDANSNFLVDCNPSNNDDGNRQFENDTNDCLEPFEAFHERDGNGGWKPAPNSTKLAVRDNLTLGGYPARVGCIAGEGETCVRDKFIHQTYALNTEVKGPGTYDPTPADPDNGDEVEGVLVDLYPTQLATSSISVFVQALNILQEESVTNTQVLRMRYAKDDPTCTSDCDRNSLIPGVITTGENGQPIFRTRAELLLDAPDMKIPLGGTHDLYGRPFTLELKGDITFFDDGRMQVEQWNTNFVGDQDELLVTANTGGFDGYGIITLELPLEIPREGVYLNFISNPVKDLPQQLRKATSEQ